MQRLAALFQRLRHTGSAEPLGRLMEEPYPGPDTPEPLEVTALMLLGRPNLQGFFDFVLSEGRRAPRQYPDYEGIIQAYQARLAPLWDAVPVFNVNGRSEVFDFDVNLPGNCVYTMRWVVPLAERVIQQHRLPVYAMNVAALATLVDNTGIDEAYLQQALQNDRPIIVAQFPAIHSTFVMDGNHRVVSRHQAGISTIKGVLLRPEIHLEAVASEFHRTMFKVHTNISLMLNYMVGHIKNVKDAELMEF